MKLANHYYSAVSGLAASLGSFFGKMIYKNVRKIKNINVWCVCEARHERFCRMNVCDAILQVFLSRRIFFPEFFPISVGWYSEKINKSAEMYQVTASQTEQNIKLVRFDLICGKNVNFQ